MGDPTYSEANREAATAVAGDDSLRLVCREVWGGNRTIDVPIELPGMVGRLFTRPCDGLRGGDLHFFATCSSGLLTRIFIADVAGHGEAVATISSVVKRTMRRYLNWPDQRSIFRRVNRELSDIGFDALTTAAAITYYPPRRRLSVSYAGHYPAWWYQRRHQTWVQLAVPERDEKSVQHINLPLAASETSTFTRTTRQVELGDRLVLLTDGVVESPDRNGELLGLAGFAELLDRYKDEPTQALPGQVVEALARRAGTALTHDDITLVAIEFVKGPAGSLLWNALRNRLFRPRGNSHEAAFAG